MNNSLVNNLSSEDVKIKGEVVRVRYSNPENNFYVFTVASDESPDQVVVKGTATSGLQLTKGANVALSGIFQEHPKYGRQFFAKQITLSQPSTEDEIERYLGSGIVKGVGEKTAKRIVEKFGNKSLETIRKHPDQVSKIPGVGKHRALLLSKAFESYDESQETLQFLVGKGLSPGLALKIYQKYKSETINLISQDPYRLTRDLHGIGFKRSDEIALKSFNLAPDSPQRLKAGVFYALESSRNDGHCYLPVNTLIQRASVILGLNTEQDLSAHIFDLENEGFIVIEDEKIYLKTLYLAEKVCADFISRRCGFIVDSGIKVNFIESCIKAAEKKLDLKFSQDQIDAIHYATQYKLLIITGGPGCGKTTLIKGLTSVFAQAKKNILLAAPTGRAAQKMASVCELDAQTIHRLLKYDPIKRSFLFNKSNQLKLNDEPIDVLIIDESSMIDIQLAKDLFSAIPATATLILVGDKDQLPSVGPGRMFADLVSLDDVKTIKLSKLFRRSEESAINFIAHQINSGIPPEIPEPDGQVKTDAYFISRKTPSEAAQLIESLVADQIPKKFGIDQSEIAVLTPSNRGELGTIELNKQIQAKVNPFSIKANEIELGEMIIRRGDKVCQRVNNYNIDSGGVFNGDLGIVTKVNRKENSIVVKLWDDREINYNSADINQLSLAYASTVHRSQGSEIPCVVLALHESHYTLLERQLIYTAVTRAKKLLIVVGSYKALSLAAKRATAKHRLTFLKNRVLELNT
ncbi:MAG: ATP-dependent RecD-like DNA helicase [Bdellovibrionales bacterium]|nr:ATP-dependent RecD-like DNA helicase [Bdellovibrionales bacterium]